MAKMLTSRQIIVLIIALVESFILSAHYAVFMPFYPNVAKDKGNTPSEVRLGILKWHKTSSVISCALNFYSNYRSS